LQHKVNDVHLNLKVHELAADLVDECVKVVAELADVLILLGIAEQDDVL